MTASTKHESQDSGSSHRRAIERQGYDPVERFAGIPRSVDEQH
jgi:hypothetical protein